MSVPSFQALGFTRVTGSGLGRSAPSFFHSWLYRHDHAAQDGSYLYLALPFGIQRWRLSMLPWPLATPDIVQDLAIDDFDGLGQAVQTFFAAHGGEGDNIVATPNWRPVGFPQAPTR